MKFLRNESLVGRDSNLKRFKFEGTLADRPFSTKYFNEHHISVPRSLIMSQFSKKLNMRSCG